MANNKVALSDGTVLIDLSGDTVTSSDHIMNGYVGHLADGTQVTGTGQGGSTPQYIYCGTSTPSSGLGSDGDVYILASSGGSLELYPASFEAAGMNYTSYASECIGVSAADGSSSRNMNSSGNGKTGTVDYTFDIPTIPSNATITSISCRVKAHEENQSKSEFTLQLYAGSTAKGSATTVSGTSNTTYTLSVGSWTATEVNSLILHTTYGRYGGLVAGATLSVTYTVADVSYDVTLTGTTSSWSISGGTIYRKSGGSWSTVSSITLGDTIARGSI